LIEASAPNTYSGGTDLNKDGAVGTGDRGDCPRAGHRLRLDKRGSLAEADLRLILDAHPGLLCCGNHLIERLCRNMSSWFSDKEPSALDEARMNVAEESTKVRNLMGRPEGQHEVDGAIQAEGGRFASVCPNTIGDPGSFYPLLKDVQHLLLQVNGNHAPILTD